MLLPIPEACNENHWYIDGIYPKETYILSTRQESRNNYQLKQDISGNDVAALLTTCWEQ